MRHGTEINMKLLFGRWDQLPVRSLHRPQHRTRKIRYGTRPLTLRNLDLIRMIDQMVVRKGFEEFDGLCLVMGSPARRFGLARPKHRGVRGMALFKRLPVLRVP